MNIEHLFLRGFILNMRPAQITSIDKIFLTRGEMNNPKKQLKSWPVQPLTPNPVPMSARMDSHAQLDPSTTVRAEVSYNHLEFDARLHKRKVSPLDIGYKEGNDKESVPRPQSWSVILLSKLNADH